MVRDLINAPANVLGPAELAKVVLARKAVRRDRNVRSG